MRRALDDHTPLPLDSLPSAALAAMHAALCAPTDPASGVHHPRDAAAFRCACRTFREVAMLPDRLKVRLLLAGVGANGGAYGVVSAVVLAGVCGVEPQGDSLQPMCAYQGNAATESAHRTSPSRTAGFRLPTRPPHHG